MRSESQYDNMKLYENPRVMPVSQTPEKQSTLQGLHKNNSPERNFKKTQQDFIKSLVNSYSKNFEEHMFVFQFVYIYIKYRLTIYIYTEATTGGVL